MSQKQAGTQEGGECGTQKKKPKVETVLIFRNGSVAAFSGGNQVAELQEKNVLDLFVEFATSKGYDLRGCEIRMNDTKTLVTTYLALKLVAKS